MTASRSPTASARQRLTHRQLAAALAYLIDHQHIAPTHTIESVTADPALRALLGHTARQHAIAARQLHRAKRAKAMRNRIDWKAIAAGNDN